MRESSNITETPHEEKGRDDWLDLPPSSQTKRKDHTNKRTERQIDEEKQTFRRTTQLVLTTNTEVLATSFTTAF